MRTFLIPPDDAACQLLETSADQDRGRITARFLTEEWAQAWLDNHLRVLNMVGLVTWMRTQGMSDCTFLADTLLTSIYFAKQTQEHPSGGKEAAVQRHTPQSKQTATNRAAS